MENVGSVIRMTGKVIEGDSHTEFNEGRNLKLDKKILMRV